MSTQRTTISMPDELWADAVKRQKAFGYSTFSDYIQALVRADVVSQAGTHLREAAEASPKKPAQPGSASYRPARKKPKGQGGSSMVWAGLAAVELLSTLL